MRNIFLGLIFSLMLPPVAAFAKNDTLTTYGDVMQFALPAGAFGYSVLEGDTEGQKELLRDLVASMALTEATKYATNNTYLGRRPGKSNSGHAFPSGHTTSACAGSGYLGKRYGWEYGLPAFGLAALTGYSRVDADEHHWRDVIAGCGISYLMTGFFVTKEGAENLNPVIGPDFIGFRWDLPFN